MFIFQGWDKGMRSSDVAGSLRNWPVLVIVPPIPRPTVMHCILIGLFFHFILCASQAQLETLPKAQRTRGLSSSCQSDFLSSYHKFKHKSWSNYIFRISIKHQLLNQASASPINLKFKLLTKLSFENSTKIQLHNLYKTSAAKCWTNSSSQINKLLPTWSSASTSATVTTSKSFELVYSKARVTSIKSTKRHRVSQLVS